MKSGSKGESHSPKNHSNMAENQKLKETITHSIPQTRVSSESVSPTTSTSVSTPQKNGFPMASPSTSGSGKRRTAMHKIKDPNIKGSPAEPSSNQIITEEEKNRLEAVQRDWRLSRPTKSYAKSSHMLYDGPSITQKSNSPNITPRKIVLSSSMKSPSVTNNIHPTEDEKAVENVNLHDPASIFGDSAQNIISNVDLHVSVDSMGHSTDTSGYLTTHQHSDVKQETNIPPPIIEITESSVVIEPIAEITEKCETAVEQPSVDESKMVEEIVKEEVKVKKARDRRKIRTLSSTSSECTSSSEDEEIFRAFSTTGREKHVESEEEVEEKPIDKSPDGRFLKFDEEIGSGSFKTVYRGLDSETGVAVAWCELQENKLNKAERQRFREEAEMLKGLQHPNIVRFYDYWERQDGSKRKYIVLVTELMSSGTLKTYIKRFKKFNAKVLKSWCRQILKGLSFLHSRNPPVIHRDLKCDNIFITGTTGSVKIGDLGLATLKNKSHAKSVIGTPEFMAPEMYDEMYDEMVDIYAFGMCLLEMVTGEYPYAECNSLGQIYKKVVAGIKPECFNRIPEEYPEIKEIIDRCIRLHKEERVNVKQLLSDDCFIPDEDLGIRIDIINRDTELTGTNTEIKMQLKIFNDEKRKLYQFKENEGLQFAFDIMQDNPEEVVQQMIDQQHVPENEKRWIIKLVRDKMDAFKRDREFRHSEAKRLREEEERKAEYFAIQEELKLRAIEKIRKENERIENERIESERIENETNQQEALANQARLQQQRMLEDQASQEQVQQNNGHIIRQGFINPINVQETTNCELSSFSSRLDDLEMPMTPNGDVIDGAKSKKSRRKVVIVVKEITRENDDTTYIHAILDTNTRSITFTFQLETHHPSLIIRQLVEGNCLEESNAGLVEELLSTVITKIKEEPDDTIGMKVMNVYDNSGNIIKLSEMTTVPSVKKQLPPRLDESIVDSGSNVPPTCKSRFGVTPVSIPPCTSTLPDHQNAPTLSPTFIEPQVANLQAQFQGNNSSSINNQTNLTQSPSSSRPENAPLSPVVVNSRFTVQPTACAPEPKTLQQVNTSTTDNIENIVQTHNLPQQHAETVTLPEHVAQHISEVTFINPAVNANTVHGNMVYQQPIPMTNNPLVCEKKLTNSKLKGTHLEALEQELRKVSGVTGVTEDGEIISTSHICQSHQNTISNPNKDMYYSPPRTHQQYFHLNNLNLYTEENHQPQTYVYSEMTGNTQQVNNFAPPDLNNTNNVQANYMEQEHTSFNVEDSRPKTQQSFTTEHNIMSPTISKQHTSEHSRSVSPHSRQGYYPETTFIPQDNRVYDGQHLHYQPPQNQSSHMQQPPIVHQQQPQVAEQTHTGIIQHPQVQVVQQPGTPLIQGHFHYPHQQNIQLQQNQQQHIQQNVAHQQPHMHHHVDTHHIPSQMPVHHQNQSQQQQHQQQPQFQQMQQPQLQHQQPQHQIQHQQAQQFQSQPQQHQTQPQQYQSQPHQHQPQLQPQPQQHQPQPQQHQPQHQQLQPQTQQYQSQPQQQHQSHVQTSAIAVHHQPLKSNMAQHKSQTLPPVSHQQSTVHHAAGEPHVHYQHLPTEKVHTHVDMGTKICHHVPPPSHHYQTVPAQHFHQHPAVYNSTMSPLLPSDPHILDMQELLNQMIATNMFYQQQGHQFQNQMEQLISRSQQVNSQNYCNPQQEKNQSVHYGHQHSIHHTQLTNVQQQGGTGEYLSNTSSHSQTPAIIKQPSHSLHGLNEKLNILSQKQQNNEPLFTQSLCPSLQFIPKMASEDDGQGTSNQMTYPSTVVPGTHQVKTFVGLENALKKVIHPDMRDSQSVPPSVVQGKELVQSSANGTIQGHPHQITELELYQNFNNLPIHFHSCHPHDHYDTIDADVGTIDLELSIYREDLVQLTLLRHRRELQELRDRQCNELRHIKHKASMLRSKSMTPRSKNNNVVVNHSCCFKCPCC